MALNSTHATAVRIDAVIISRRSSVQLHSEANRFPLFCCSEHEVKITRVKTEENLSGWGLQDCAFLSHFPSATQRPLIQRDPRLWGVSVARILSDVFSRCKVFSSAIPNVGLR